MPRPTAMPAACASAALGRIPAAKMTASAAMRVPSASSMPCTCPSPKIAFVLALRRTSMPLPSTRRFSSAAAGASSCRSISRSIKWTKRHRRAGLGEAVGRFQAEQTAADHDDALLRCCQLQQQIDVAAVAERMHARQARRPECSAATAASRSRTRASRTGPGGRRPARRAGFAGRPRSPRVRSSASRRGRATTSPAAARSPARRSRRPAPTTAARGYRRAAARRR